MKIQTKDKIFDVALDLFSKKGYDSVSIRTIASEVGIKESSIYNHYSSKKEILMSILKYFEEYFQGNPLDDENVGENVYLNMINQAYDYLYITTPYLILDDNLQTALINAAKRGVDVRIITPGIPDKKIVFRVTRSY